MIESEVEKDEEEIRKLDELCRIWDQLMDKVGDLRRIGYPKVAKDIRVW